MKQPVTSCMMLAMLLSSAAAYTQAPATAASASPTLSGCPAPGEGRGRPPGGGAGPGGAGQPGYARAGGPPPEGDRPSGPPKKRLLIWADTMNGVGQHDSVAHAEAIIEELGYKTGLYTTYIRTDSAIIAKRPKMTTGEPASGGPSLCNVDAIFFLGHREINLDAQQKADLLWFVHDAGKGFVSAHTGITAFMSWPEFNEMIGAQFDNHPWGITDAHVIVTDPKFPGVQQFGTDFNIREEFYQAKNYVAARSHTIMRLDTKGLDMTRPQVMAADYPYPLVWAKMYGKGHVFYSAFGHADAMWDDPRMQDMYLSAIKWALGMEGDPDITPNPMPTPAAH